MAIVIPPGYAQVIVHLHDGNGGKDCENVFGWVLASPPTQEDVDAFCTELAASYHAILANYSRFVGITVLVGQDGGDPLVYDSAEGAGLGDRSGDSLPPQCQMLAKKTSSTFGRKGRGRTFLINPLDSQTSNDGTLESAGMTALQAWCDAVMGSGSDGGVFTAMCILHNSSTLPSVVTSFTAEAKIATLRDRFLR